MIRGRRAAASPRSRPLGALTEPALRAELDRALGAADGIAGAHAIHELWMRGEMGILVERELAALWKRAAGAVPDWLPMRYVDRLADFYEITGRFAGAGRGLMGPTLHLQGLKRGDAARIEEGLAEALTAAGFFVQGGH